jgi:histidinol phosphatase-like enzyme
MLHSIGSDVSVDWKASWMVGDTDADVAAGQAAGVRTIVINNPATTHKRKGLVADALAADLEQAVRIILESDIGRRAIG